MTSTSLLVSVLLPVVERTKLIGEGSVIAVDKMMHVKVQLERRDGGRIIGYGYVIGFILGYGYVIGFICAQLALSKLDVC